MIENIREFRQSSDHVAPSTICAYQMLDGGANPTPLSNSYKTQQIQSVKRCNNAKHNEIREQLRKEIYSQFDEKPTNRSNGFINKSETAEPKGTIDSSAKSLIAEEVQKLFSQYTSVQNVYGAGNQRRLEVLQQSQNLIKDEIKKQIYAPFQMSDSKISPSSEQIVNNVSFVQKLQSMNDKEASTVIQDFDLIDLNSSRPERDVADNSKNKNSDKAEVFTQVNHLLIINIV